MNKIFSVLLALLLVALFSCLPMHKDEGLEPSKEVYAFHTSINKSKKAHERYEDLIVKFDTGQLIFAKKEAFAPVWYVNGQQYALQDYYPNRDLDKNARYAYVRVLSSNEDQIVIHYKHVPRLKGIFKSIDENPLFSGGITDVVHEIFVINRDYSIMRKVKDAHGTRYEDWIHPEFGSSQEIVLNVDGIEQSDIIQGRAAPIYPRPAYEGSDLIDFDNSQVLMKWSFDDGMKPHEDDVLEEVTKTKCPIRGTSTHYEKGVSGTALAFDGYYTSVAYNGKQPELGNEFSISAWLAPDAYPYNKVPIIHQSKGWGKEGFYLGLDPYGYLIFTVNGNEIKSAAKINFGQWTFVTASLDNSKIRLFVNGEVVSETIIGNTSLLKDLPIQIGMNNELDRASDYVRSVEQNINYTIGFQGLIDEVSMLSSALDETAIKNLYLKYKPVHPASGLALSSLPGKQETGKFGAYYVDLELNAVWNKLWRDIEKTDIAVEFDDVKGAVKFWRGTNYASNWITENNIWMADQSTETWGPHGCSEHMSDKQNRQTFARIIENSPARAVIHWRYPCVDIGYVNNNEETNWSDEYYYVYPDGTAIRKVNFNGRGLANPDEEDEEDENIELDEEEDIELEEEEEIEADWLEFQRATEEWVKTMEGFREQFYHPENNTWEGELVGWGGPGFQDVQLLVEPGKEALDLVGLNAMDVANVYGEVQQLNWELPNKTPFVQIHDACIELVKSKSEFRTFEIFQGGYISPWGRAENSAYTPDPFAGPWNHWPVNLLPSDGRYAVSNDRIGHFALGGNDALPDVGAMVLHGMTNKSIETLIPLAKSWKTPPAIENLNGLKSGKYVKEQKAFLLDAESYNVSFDVLATDNSPIVNPAFVISNWSIQGDIVLHVNGEEIKEDQFKIGYERDSRGKRKLVLWMKYSTNKPTSIEITQPLP